MKVEFIVAVSLRQANCCIIDIPKFENPNSDFNIDNFKDYLSDQSFALDCNGITEPDEPGIYRLSGSYYIDFSGNPSFEEESREKLKYEAN